MSKKQTKTPTKKNKKGSNAANATLVDGISRKDLLAFSTGFILVVVAIFFLVAFVSYIENTYDIVDGLVQVIGRLMLFELESVVVDLIGGLEKFGRRNPRLRELYPYKALAYFRMGYYGYFMSYLKKCQRMCPENARAVLSFLFPKGMEPQDYYQYMANNLSRIVEEKGF